MSRNLLVPNLQRLKQNLSSMEFFFVYFSYDPNGALPRVDELLGNHFVSAAEGVFVICSSNFQGNSLVSISDEGWSLFRGYELDRGFRSYQNLQFDDALSELRNGVFCGAQFSRKDRAFSIKSDVFGISPVYLKETESGVYFSSHYSLLIEDGACPDLVGQLSMLKNGFSVGQRTCFGSVERMAPASLYRYSAIHKNRTSWFDFGSLECRGRTVDKKAVEEVELLFSQAMQRCCALAYGNVCLPFSSGYDSRRILGYLLDKRVDFSAVTARSLKRIGSDLYDIDARFAGSLCRALGISHETVELPSLANVPAWLGLRDEMYGSESWMHDWAVPLVERLSQSPPGVIFDGLGGDVLGNSGYESRLFHDCSETNIGIFFAETLKQSLDPVLGYGKEVIEQFVYEYWNFLASLPFGSNQSEIAFLLTRTRRSVSTWIAASHSSSHLPVYPYFDLDYVRKCLEFLPGEKYKKFLQKECLRHFHPHLYQYPGSRDLPPNLMPEPHEWTKRMRSSSLSYYLSALRGSDVYLRMRRSDKVLLELVLKSGINLPRNWLFEMLGRLAASTRSSSNACVTGGA